MGKKDENKISKYELREQLYRCRNSFSALEAKKSVADDKITELTNRNLVKSNIIAAMAILFGFFVLYLHMEVF